MPRRVFVLLHGKRCSGKDTVAKLLHDRFGCVHVSFAEQVKREYADIYGLDLDRLLNDRDYKEEHRQGLINHAMQAREINPDWWIIAVSHTDIERDRVVVVSDHRFLNDRTVLGKENIVITVHVTASEETRKARGWTPRPEIDSHASECELDGVSDDVVVPNDGPGLPDVDPIMTAVISACLPRLQWDNLACF